MPAYIHSIAKIYSPDCTVRLLGKRYVMAVAEPYTAGRLFAAWAVLTGRAYAFQWPKTGDLESAVGAPPVEREAHRPGGEITP